MPAKLPVRHKKIVFFDYWTAGMHNFRRVARAFEGEPVSFELLHLGSLRDKSIERETVIDGIPCRDITTYGNRGIYGVLASLRPDAVVTLNIAYLPDRALCLSCRKLGIPVVYLQHGAILEKDAMDAMLGARSQGDAKWKWSDYASRLTKYGRMVPWYMQAKGELFPGAVSRDVLLKLATSPAHSTIYPPAPEELWPSRAMVYNQTDADTLRTDRGMPESRIAVVGNPELDEAFGRRKRPLTTAERKEVLARLGLRPDKPVVLHADEGWTAIGAFGWTPDLAKEYLRHLFESVQAAGAQMLVRPKPAGNAIPGPMDFSITDFCRSFPEVVVSRAASVCDSIDVSDVVVGMMSTVLESAVILGRPLLVPAWMVGEKPELSSYVKYGAAKVVLRREELVGTIQQAVRAGTLPIPSLFAARRLGPLDDGSGARMKSVLFDVMEANQERLAS